MLNIQILRTYGAIKERASYIQLDSDNKKIEEIERVFDFIPGRENRYIFRLYCLGYNYEEIRTLCEKNNIFYTYNAIKSKIRRTIQDLQQRGVIL